MSQCGFEGNPDTFGLGVRLGAYLSWASITIASTLIPRARKDLLDALVVFSIAFFAAIILESLDDETYTIELIIMGYIFFGGIVTTSLSLAQDVTLGVLVGPSRPSSESAAAQTGLLGAGQSTADGSMPSKEEDYDADPSPAASNSPAERQANPSLWRGTVLVLCVVGVAAHTFWLYWIAKPFRETPCGTWVFPWTTLHHNSLRHGPILVFGLLSFVTFPMFLTGMFGLVLFGPDLLAIAQAFLTGNRSQSVEERGFRCYNMRIYNLAQRLRGLSRGIKKRWPRR